KHKRLFTVIHFFYSPIRNSREYINRRKITNDVIKSYAKMDNSKNTIYYLGIPEHNNLGDIAQTYCTLKWIEDNYSEYNILKIRTRASFDKKMLRFVDKIWKENDFILFQSGYCTRYKNPDHLMHKTIAKIYSDKKMIILPQTVKLSNKRDVEETRKIFKKCTRFVFFARDKISFNSAKKFVSEDKLYCFPDIVTSLIGRVNIERKEKNGVLICVRNDDEKYYTDKDINNLILHLKKITEKVDKRDTNSDYSVEYTYSHLEEVIIKMVKTFAQYRVIITDRYHGTIFSLIANTPVIVVKTNDHKVTSGLEWFRGCYDTRAVQKANDLEQAYLLARPFLQDERICIENPDILFAKYYESYMAEIVTSI
ncbi:polysaccharide pyruvyl transferase family protein, partial [Agathobacter rectalis]|uniref:polysaccharide pyruvyl transferase family protein n=1 Tax=Agathobacter rectalis TaxID=39491 RepID=UPI0027D272FA